MSGRERLEAKVRPLVERAMRQAIENYHADCAIEDGRAGFAAAIADVVLTDSAVPPEREFACKGLDALLQSFAGAMAAVGAGDEAANKAAEEARIAIVGRFLRLHNDLEEASRDRERLDWMEQSGNAELSLYSERSGWSFYEGAAMREAIDAALLTDGAVPPEASTEAVEGDEGGREDARERLAVQESVIRQAIAAGEFDADAERFHQDLADTIEEVLATDVRGALEAWIAGLPETQSLPDSDWQVGYQDAMQEVCDWLASGQTPVTREPEPFRQKLYGVAEGDCGTLEAGVVQTLYQSAGITYGFAESLARTITDSFRREYERAQAPSAPSVREACEWTPDDDGIYDTACGNRFFFDSGTSEENGVRFCVYCGKRLASTLTRETP